MGSIPPQTHTFKIPRIVVPAFREGVTLKW